MNSLWIALIAILLLGVGYRFYGSFLSRFWGVDPRRKTPAVELADGIDYIPAKHWTVLFGHHFSSIAGAGPIIGPVIACAVWGWLPALIWIILGAIFIGGMHDFSALMASLRHQGRSIADVASERVSYRTKLIFASFLWLALVLVVAVFAAVGGQTLATKPQVVIPTFGLILVAVFTGLMLYRWKVKQTLATLIGGGLLFGLVVLGYNLPVSLGPNSGIIWTVILLFYAYIASVLPVNILLQPRDYLAALVLFFGLLFGYIGVFITHPQMHTPAFLGFAGESGALWPMMCVIIACGANSGFHALIASGTTSKQLSNERDAPRIAYGGMLTEGVLAVLALISVAGGLLWQEAGNLSYPILMKGKGWIVTFGEGYGQVTWPIFGGLGSLIAITTLKTFVLTTLDSATRIGRYIGEELFGQALRIKPMMNRFFSTLFITAFALYLALGDWKAIWPVFGAANQLVAALVFLVVTCYLLGLGKKIRYGFYPGLFMLVTTLGALILETRGFWVDHDYLLVFISLLLIGLAAFMVAEAIKVARKRERIQGLGSL
jgi:carbon starvation protein